MSKRCLPSLLKAPSWPARSPMSRGGLRHGAHPPCQVGPRAKGQWGLLSTIEAQGTFTQNLISA